MKIIEKQITEFIYIGSNGEEQRVSEMPNQYLINALLKANREAEAEELPRMTAEVHSKRSDAHKVVEVLKAEALSRMIGAGEV